MNTKKIFTEVFIAVFQDKGELTLKNLSEALEGHPYLGEITLQELANTDGLVRLIPYAGKSHTTPEPKKKVEPRVKALRRVNTRSTSGRKKYDKAVLDCISQYDDNGASANDIRSEVGGNEDQLRKSAARLTKAGETRRTGNCRATRYHRIWK